MKKNVIEVTNDYQNDLSWELYKEDLINLSEDLDIAVHNGNRRMNNVLPSKKIDTDGYHKKCIISCTGYSQSDWDDYTIYYNEDCKELDMLKKELSKVCTHKNDYIMEVHEVLKSGHSKSINMQYVSISHVEFPDEDDIKQSVIEHGEIICDLDPNLLTWNFKI